MPDEIEVLKKKIKKVPKEKTPAVGGLSSGLTLLNLALTGRTSYAFLQGCYYLLVGDSASGKTFLALTATAEAAQDENFDKYRLIYDASENGALMNHERFFGKKLAERIEPPQMNKDGSPLHSMLVEDFYLNFKQATKTGPCIYTEDSMDALSARDDVKKTEKQQRAATKGKDEAGSYGTAKAKLNSSSLRIAHNQCVSTGSILFIVSQTRQNIGFGSQFNPKTRAGGTSLKFYADAEMWFSIGGKITKRVNGKNRQIGSVLQVKVKKNRHTGREPVVNLHFFPSHGFDDVGTNVAYLVEEGHWVKATKGEEREAKTRDVIDGGLTIEAPEFDFKGKQEALVEWIEDNGKEKELRQLVADVWNAIDDQCKVVRKKRYV